MTYRLKQNFWKVVMIFYKLLPTVNLNNKILERRMQLL